MLFLVDDFMVKIHIVALPKQDCVSKYFTACLSKLIVLHQSLLQTVK